MASGGDREESPGGGYAFEFVLAAVVESRTRTCHEINDDPRHEHLTRLRCFTHATCEVDGAATTSTVTASTGTTPTSAAPKCVASGEAAAVVPDVIGLILPDAIAMVQSAGPNVVDGGVGQRSGMTPERREVAYEVDSTTLVTTQRCLPILRSRTNPSFS
jgi:hypothetical protein